MFVNSSLTKKFHFISIVFSLPFQPGESGYVLLGDLTVETSTDPEPEDSWLLGDPPSPCDVRFQNDNVIINGRSNIRQKKKEQRIKVSRPVEFADVIEPIDLIKCDDRAN